MSTSRKSFTAEFKAKIVLEAIRGERSMTQIASAYKVHPNQVSLWGNQLLKDSAKVFA